MDGVQLPQGQSHFKEAVYFLPLSFQKFLVLILSTSEGWKTESTLEPPSGFERGTPGLGIQRLNHRSMSLVKLFVYKTVKCEVTNVEFISRNLPLKNSVIMVKWECLKLLYSSKGTCRIDRIDTFQILDYWNTLYLFLYIQLVFYSFTHT